MINIKEKFESTFGQACTNEFQVFARAEIAGNHTDHQHGYVIAAAIDTEMRAAAAKNDTNTIRVHSEDFPEISVELSKLYPLNKEKSTSAALVRGMASRYENSVSGFDAYIESDIPSGSGMSSSAAFAVMIGKIIEGLFNCKTTPLTLAQYAQFAENVFYGKPCGLMDQITCAYGGTVAIDFSESNPEVEPLDFDPEKYGYTLCIIESGSSHENLDEYYAEVHDEITKVSNYFYKDYLSQVDKRKFKDELGSLEKYAGDRAVLRAMHVLNENFRVKSMINYLKNDNFSSFLEAVDRSGDSSWMLLQNVIPSGAVTHQRLAFAIMVSKFFLQGKGACRVMGGGFAGTLQAYVPSESVREFKINVERVLGKNSVKPVKIVNH